MSRFLHSLARLESTNVCGLVQLFVSTGDVSYRINVCDIAITSISCGVHGEWCVPRRPGGRGGTSPREPRFSDCRASVRSGVSSRDQEFMIIFL